MTTSSHHKKKILELIRQSAIVFQAIKYFLVKKNEFIIGAQKGSFGMIISNTLLFFLYDSLAAKNPQVDLKWVHAKGMCVDKAEGSCLAPCMGANLPPASSGR